MEEKYLSGYYNSKIDFEEEITIVTVCGLLVTR